MTKEEMANYLISEGWEEYWIFNEMRYWHPEFSRIDPQSVHDAYRIQMREERNRDCGCS
jgi:hypothetical protein